MSTQRARLLAPSDETAAAADIVERFLEASMVPDPVKAATFIAPELAITFTGGRKYTHPRETAAFNARRYKWVKKRFERTSLQRWNFAPSSTSARATPPPWTSIQLQDSIVYFTVPSLSGSNAASP